MADFFKQALSGSEAAHSRDSEYMTLVASIMANSATQLGPFGQGIAWDDVAQGNPKMVVNMDDPANRFTRYPTNQWRQYIQDALDAAGGIPWFSSTLSDFPNLGSNADYKYVATRTNPNGLRRLFEGIHFAEDPDWPTTTETWTNLCGYDDDSTNANRTGWWGNECYGGSSGHDKSGVLASGAKIDSLLWTPAQWGATPSHKLGLVIPCDHVSTEKVNGALRTDGQQDPADTCLPYGCVLAFDWNTDPATNTNAAAAVVEHWMQHYGAVVVDALPASPGAATIYVKNDSTGWQTATGLTTLTGRHNAMAKVRWDKVHVLDW